MILKIVSARNVGRLREFAWSKGVPPASKLVGVFAENGVGKSTLVAILRSAGTSDPRPLLQRRSLPEKGAPAVHLVVQGSELRFQDGVWTGTPPQIAIFDKTFVAENVYDGREVGADQREGLYRLALGVGEVDAAKHVTTAKKDKKDVEDKVKRLKEPLERRCAEVGKTLDVLRQVEPLDAPPVGLAHSEDRLASLRRTTDLSKLPTFSPVTPVPAGLNAEGLLKLLDANATTLSAEAAAAVKNHVSAHLDPAGETWLRQGVAYAAKGSDCPYCGQDLSTSALADLWPTYFDTAYQRLLGTLDKAVERVGAWDAWAATLSAAHHGHRRAWTAWSQLVDLPEPPDLAPASESATRLVIALRGLMVAKQARPLEPLGADPRLTTVLTEHEALSNHLRTTSLWVAHALTLTTRVSADHAGELRRLADEVGTAKARVLRGVLATEITELGEVEKKADECGKAVKAAEEALAARESGRPKGFVDRINGVLAEFGAGFRLSNLQRKPTATRVSADFDIALADHDGPIAGTTIAASVNPSGKPRFDTVLSEGDRTTLGLAVFLASCLGAPDSTRVVVLDDPFTSLDAGRRTKTRRYIDDLVAVSGQVWVLSHDAWFMRDSLHPHGAASTSLQLIQVGSSTELVSWDAQGACRSRYEQELRQLEAFVAHQRHAPRAPEAAKLVRSVVEGFLKFRCRRVYEREARMSLESFVRSVEHDPTDAPSDILSRLPLIREFKDFANREIHAYSDGDDGAPAQSEVRTIVAKVVTFVHG